ncbi:hypothetical protein CPA45_11770 [Vreelandella nigrificans]|uniref:Uncharacterized protein n=1 Tax=Vreelandella nigrificans TaxID=2042704 RepID=A0A2A4HMU4_9GAMM|nr:hypothetical protein CPA45_11770 [Halomonas nigrificans]
MNAIKQRIHHLFVGQELIYENISISISASIFYYLYDFYVFFYCILNFFKNLKKDAIECYTFIRVFFYGVCTFNVRL